LLEGFSIPKKPLCDHTLVGVMGFRRVVTAEIDIATVERDDGRIAGPVIAIRWKFAGRTAPLRKLQLP
jgi:hypothetical protein